MHCKLGLDEVGAIQAVETVGSHYSALGKVHLVLAGIFCVEFEIFVQRRELPHQRIGVVKALVLACFMKVKILIPNCLHIGLFDEFLEVQGELVLLGFVRSQQVDAHHPIVQLLHLQKVPAEG